jgi:DNA-binding winged helix-turn-helix (wHTH) protein
MATDTDWINGSAEALILFGPFRLLPKQRLLMEGDKLVHVGSRAFDVLIALLERPGELVSKEELIARVWPNTFVAPANLAVHISALRRALGDGCAGSRYVVNIHGRGYRFVAPVTIVEDPPPLTPAAGRADDPSPWAPAASAPGRAEAVDELGQHLPQGYLLAIVGSGDARDSRLRFALLHELSGAQQNGVWLVDVKSAEDS